MLLWARNELESMQKWKETLQSIDDGLLLLGRNKLASMQKWKETLQSIDDDLQFFFSISQVKQNCIQET